jgi:hypothetical protein
MNRVTDWQVTATTIYCDAVDDEVTLVVDKGWNIKCTGYTRYVTHLDKETGKTLKQKFRQSGRNLKCEGPQDFRVTGYRDRLMAQEKTDNK